MGAGDVNDTLRSEGPEGVRRRSDKARRFNGELTAQAAPQPGVKDAGLDLDPIPPRQWLLGNTFCREFLSGLTGSGGTGKTALRLLQCIAAALDRGGLVGEHVFRRCRALIVCLEDGENEVRRHIRAACLHHGISQSDLAGWLFYWTPKNTKLIEIDGRGGITLGGLDDELRAIIDKHKIDIVEIDPFVKTHGIPESDNTNIDRAATILVTIGIECNCAVDFVHHHRKGANQPGDADSGRGGSSLKDAGRLIYTLTPMSQDEAKLFDVSERDRRSLVRLDSAKVNLVPPSDQARWFRLVGVPLNNATPDYPKGDEVQTVEIWNPPDIWRAITIQVANQVLDRIDAGVPGAPEGRRFSGASQSQSRSAAAVVQEFCPTLKKDQAQRIIRTWLKNGILKSETYHDPERSEPRPGLFVIKRPGDTWEA